MEWGLPSALIFIYLPLSVSLCISPNTIRQCLLAECESAITARSKHIQQNKRHRQDNHSSTPQLWLHRTAPYTTTHNWIKFSCPVSSNSCLFHFFAHLVVLLVSVSYTQTARLEAERRGSRTPNFGGGKINKKRMIK